MRSVLLFLALLLCASATVWSETPYVWPVLKTVDGRVYKNARVLEVQPDGVKVSHEGGEAVVLFQDMEDSAKAEFGSDPQTATKARMARQLEEHRI